MINKHGIDRSEPDVFLALGQRMPGWAVMVGLIGSGQEIYKGEEAGLAQWNEAIRNTGGRWTVHCPEAAVDGVPLASQFTAAAAVVVRTRRLPVAVALHARATR